MHIKYEIDVKLNVKHLELIKFSRFSKKKYLYKVDEFSIWLLGVGWIHLKYSMQSFTYNSL